MYFTFSAVVYDIRYMINGHEKTLICNCSEVEAIDAAIDYANNKANGYEIIEIRRLENNDNGKTTAVTMNYKRYLASGIEIPKHIKFNDLKLTF